MLFTGSFLGYILTYGDDIAMDFFFHIGRPAFMTVLLVVIGRSMIRILDMFGQLLIHTCVAHSLGTCAWGGQGRF